ncbi:hypothetical protein [Ensifer canadensis]
MRRLLVEGGGCRIGALFLDFLFDAGFRCAIGFGDFGRFIGGCRGVCRRFGIFRHGLFRFKVDRQRLFLGFRAARRVFRYHGDLLPLLPVGSCNKPSQAGR